MLMAVRRQCTQDDGFSLIELLVSIVLVAIVGGIMLTGLVQAFRTNEMAQERIDAFNEVQIAMERMTRELRAADPVLLPPAATALRADDVLVQIFRDGQAVCWRYWVQDNTVLASSQPSTNDCATFTSPTPRTILRDVEALDIEYRDRDGNEVTQPEQVVTISLSITQRVGRQDPVVLRTLLDVRNAR